MRKGTEALTQVKNFKTIGNHSVMVFDDRREFYYHGNNIYTHYFDNNKPDEYCYCGWYTRSTQRTINDYTRYYHKEVIEI